MKRYYDVEEIIPHIDNIKSVSKEDAFHFYKYDSGEHKKWLEEHRERKTQEHFELFEKIFNSREWFFGNIRISSLHLATMCIGSKFLNRLACSKVTCPEFYKINCSCNDSEQIQTPTFKKSNFEF